MRVVLLVLSIAVACIVFIRPVTASSQSRPAPQHVSPFACNRAALTPEARKHHFDEVGPSLRARITKIRELTDGFEFETPSDALTFQLLTEWVAAEHLCCPFFDIDVRLEREAGPLRLRLTGPEGVKQFIRADFLSDSKMAPTQRTVSADHLRSGQALEVLFNIVENRLLTSAEAMPADKYSFAPTIGEFKGVRTFGQQLKHAAATNYILAASALGEESPADVGDEVGPESVRTKAEIIEYLKGSFARLHQAMNAIDAENHVLSQSTPISPLQPGGTATRLGLVVEALIHAYDHYGQMVEYLRMNSVIPPASR
jgi:hypothetical protein